MRIGGENTQYSFGEEAKNDDFIVPPCDSHIQISTLLSFSIFHFHSISITKDKKAFALGSNTSGQISNTLEHKEFSKEKVVEFRDEKGRTCKFISAVCGSHYTLYLILNDSKENHQLAYIHSDSKKSLFLNITGHNPIHLYGGEKTSAAVDTDGCVLVINKLVFSNSYSPSYTSLPSGEKAVSVACCDDFIVVAGSSGGAFEASLKDLEKNQLTFKKVSELESIYITEVSGKCEHCFAVCRDGRVFVKGTDFISRLGLGKGKKAPVFTLVSSLKDYKIVSASASYDNSYFITSEGKVLACGNNSHGELLTGKKTDTIYLPVETTITSGATFCIAGIYKSAVFVGCDPPANTPNQVIKSFITEQPSKKMDESDQNKDLKIKELEKEIARLRKENAKLNASFQRSGASENITFDIEILDSSTINNLDRLEEIGSGSGGRVYKVAKKQLFALKELSRTANNEDLRRFLGEYEVMNILRHPNIVRTFGFFLSDANTPPCILLELCKSSLDTAIKQGLLSNSDIVVSLFQIAEGMRYVHFRHVVHRDLKPSNIFIASDGSIKIGDFGISKLMSPGEQSSMTGGIGTQKFMAPEIVNEDDYDEKVDVYSFGVLVFFMLNNGDLSPIKVIDVYRGRMPKLPTVFSQSAKNLVSSCMQLEAMNRPSFEEIVSSIEKNRHELVKLSSSEKKEVDRRIAEHKSKIPPYK